MKVKWNPIGPITEEIEKAAMDRLERAGKYVEYRAKLLCPVGKYVPKGKGKWSERIPGTLRASIHTERDDKTQVVRIVAGNERAYYAYWVETGTVKMSPRKYLRPAFRSPQVKMIVEGM